MAEGKIAEFAGTVVQFERDGFGIVRFDHPIGPSANTVGLVSSSSGTTVVSGSAILGNLEHTKPHKPFPGPLLSVPKWMDIFSRPHSDLSARLRPGTHVTGIAEVDESGVATVKAMRIVEPT